LPDSGQWLGLAATWLAGYMHVRVWSAPAGSSFVGQWSHSHILQIAIFAPLIIAGTRAVFGTPDV